MGITDKISGRAKQAIGDLTGNDATAREGRREERKAEAEEELARSQEQVERKAAEVADLDRKT